MGRRKKMTNEEIDRELKLAQLKRENMLRRAFKIQATIFLIIFGGLVILFWNLL